MDPQPVGRFTPLKMYILVKASLPVGLALVAVAHASLAAYLRFQATPEVAAWQAVSFLKNDLPGERG